MHVARSEHCFRVWETGQREVEKAIIYVKIFVYVGRLEKKKVKKKKFGIGSYRMHDVEERSQSNTCRLTATIN